MRASATGLRIGAGLAEHVGHTIGLVALFGGEAIGFAAQLIELAGCLLLLFATKQIGGLAETIRGAASIGFGLPLRSGAAHIVIGLSDLVQSLLDARITALRAAGSRLTALALTLTAGLALLAALLSGLLLTLLTLLALLLHLLHLALQFFGFAAEHLLLPALVGSLDAIVALGGQLFLAARQLFELLQSFVDLLILLAGRGSALLRLVLIFLGIEFEIEEAR